MKTANFLIDAISLNFDPPAKDLSFALEEFFLAHDKAKHNGDKIFNSPDIWEMTSQVNGVKTGFIEVITSVANASSAFPWLTLTHRQLLIRKIINYPASSKPARNLQELETEFTGEHNGILGVEDNHTAKRVFDIPSWFLLHSEYLKLHPEFIDWTKNDVLPLTEYSNLCILELVQKVNVTLTMEQEQLDFFRNKYIRTLRKDKGELMKLAKEIALRNCYTENREISSKEQKLKGKQRLIFEITKENEKQYLSLDFENGQFEVCNKRGIHIGVYNFSGERTEEAKSPSHDIDCLKN